MSTQNKKTIGVNRSYIRVRKRELNSEPKNNTIKSAKNRINIKHLSILTESKNISNDKITSFKKNYIFIENNDTCSDYHIRRKHKKNYVKSLRDKIFNKVIIDLITHLKKYIISFYKKRKMFHFFLNQFKISMESNKKYNEIFIYKKLNKLNKPFEYINNCILTTNEITKLNKNNVFDLKKTNFLKNKISSLFLKFNNTINYSSIKNNDVKEIYHKKFISNNSTQRNISESNDNKRLQSIRNMKNPLNEIQFRNLNNINRPNTPAKLIKKNLHKKIKLYRKKNFVAKKTEKILSDDYDGYSDYSNSSNYKYMNNSKSNFVNYYNNIANGRNKIHENSNELMFFLKIDSFICHIFNIFRKYRNIYAKFFLTQLKLLKSKKSKISIDKMNYISNKNININIIKTRKNKNINKKLNNNNNFIYEKLNYKPNNKNNQKLRKITSGRLLFEERKGRKIKIEQNKKLYLQNIAKYFIGNDMELIKKWFGLWRNNTKKILCNKYFYRKKLFMKKKGLSISVNKFDKGEDIKEKMHYFKILLIGFIFNLNKNRGDDSSNNLL